MEANQEQPGANLFQQVVDKLQGVSLQIGMLPLINKNQFLPPAESQIPSTEKETVFLSHHITKSEDAELSHDVKSVLTKYRDAAFSENGPYWNELTRSELSLLSQAHNSRNINVFTASYKNLDTPLFAAEAATDLTSKALRTNPVTLPSELIKDIDPAPLTPEPVVRKEVELLIQLSKRIGMKLPDRPELILQDARKNGVDIKSSNENIQFSEVRELFLDMLKRNLDWSRGHYGKRSTVLLAEDFESSQWTERDRNVFDKFKTTIKTELADKGLLGVLHIATPQEKQSDFPQPVPQPTPSPA